MDELRESSLLFSLEGLLETERDRVRREAREAQARREAEIKGVAEAAERRSALLREQRAAQERRDALTRERERVEHERREALKQATIERARIEAESGLRLVEAEQQRRHQLELSRIREQQGAARYRALAWLSSGALAIALLGAVSAYFGWLAPAHARERQHLESRIREGAARTRAAELALAVEQSNRRAVSARLASMPTAVVEAPPPAVEKPRTPPAGKLPRAPLAGSRGACRDTGDPLDNCLR